MPVGGDDDTVAGSLPAFTGTVTPIPEAELIAGRYRILRWLGGGGMGRVYEALDTELAERVALKVLNGGLTEEAIERFRREVKLTRRIQHKNVARMFDIGEHAGERFLTMELIDGEPLTRRMSERALPWFELEPIALQICEGLAAAHASGVVHRDLKPDNVLIERHSERAVLTDFGIARASDDASVTQVGAIVGTPRYMAPEQLAGEEVTPRTDLFAFGVMLFELATGTRPWAGDNAIAIAVAQATSPPRSMDTVVSVPGHVTALVRACLQIDPANRPASATEVIAALTEKRPPVVARDQAKQLTAESPRARTPSIAPRVPATPPVHEPATLTVAPIACAPDDEYLADGLLEDLTDTLSTTPGLRVRPAGVTRQTAGSDPRELGHRLAVDHVVAASVRRTPKGLRITTRLVSVADGFQIWAHRTDCTEGDVLTVADDLARGIAEALSTRATGEHKQMDSRAVALYLRARTELRRFWGSHAQAAASLLDQALEYAPSSGPLLAASAWANVQAWVMRGEAELKPHAEAALQRGLATGQGEAHLAASQFWFNTGELERGATELARALARSPMLGQVHELAGRMLLEIDGTATARGYYETARGLDPGRNQVIDTDVARIDALENKWPDVEERTARMLADPDTAIQQLGFITRARLDSWRGRIQVISREARESIPRVSPNAGAILGIVALVQEGGTLDRARWNETISRPTVPNTPHRQVLVRLQIFCELAFALNEPDLGLDALEKVAHAGLMDRTWLVHCPLLTAVSEHPRYSAARQIIDERANRVLAAFRAASS